MDWIYSTKVKDHFKNPLNILDDIESYKEDGKGQVGSPQCGDVMLIAIKVDKEKNLITDCKWKTYGCASAIASTSVLSQMVIGKDLIDAYNITPKDVLEILDGLPENKIHCSVLGDRALRKAIDDYYERNGITPDWRTEDNKVVCSCFNITSKDIENRIKEEEIESFDDFVELTKITTSCKDCTENARVIFEEKLIAYEEDSALTK